MVECPGTSNRATRVIAEALAQAAEHQFDFGYSVARQVHDALEKEGLLVHESSEESKTGN